MYKSAADALMGLILGKEKEVSRLPWKIKSIEKPTRMRNGIDYYYVEVTFGNGAQYGISAYGDEAGELRRRALALERGGETFLRPMVAR